MTKKKKQNKISKMKVDKTNLKAETIPNPVVTGGPKEIGLHRIRPIEIPKYLMMHPALPRGIEMKANRMIKLLDVDLEQNILPNKKGGEEVDAFVEYCKKIVVDSGGPLFIKAMMQGAYRFGTGMAILQTNVAENEVLKFEYQHPIFFGPALYPLDVKTLGWGDIPKAERTALAGKMKIDPKTKVIDKYTQLTKKYPERNQANLVNSGSNSLGSAYNAPFGGYADNEYDGLYVNTRTNPNLVNRTPGVLVPVGDEFDQDVVFQLVFDRLGDEPLGISLVQFLFLTIQYLIEMEQAGAQTMVNFGFNKWVANTPFKDAKKMKQFGKSLANIQKDSVVVLPKEIEIKAIQPGTTDFDKVHPIYLQLIAMRLGIPMSLLTQSGTETNKATIQEMRKDMYDDFIADELVVEEVMNDAFFKACHIKYPDKTLAELEKLVPKFKFKQPPEDLDAEIERNLKFSLMVRNFATAATDFSEIGKENVVEDISTTVSNILEHNRELHSGHNKQLEHKEKNKE